ncbi:MAG: hypothetical protein FJ119_00080 [Deltaproteobacteria bacterium]|nr:hypothetical protein [Deltaproteobacteria bacterium]
MNRDLLRQQCIQLWRSGSRPRTLATSGLSMYPLIPDGSTLTFMPATVDRSITVGDIALFERSGILVAHRIVGKFYQDGCLWFCEKGDNMFCPGTFPASSLIGRVIHIEHTGHILDLTLWRQRIAGRLAGQYWCALFALMRAMSACGRRLGCVAAPQVRASVVSAFRFLTRLPARFIRM